MTKYNLNAKYKKENGEEVDMTEELIMGLKLPLQLREITKWFLKTYGTGVDVEQDTLFKALDSHQEDNQVLSRTPVQPISRVMGFYRGRLEEIGLYKVDMQRAPRAPKTDAEGNPIKKPEKKSKRKMAEEAVESGAITEEQAAQYAEGEAPSIDPAAQVM